MEIQFLGAAREVTGSMHLLRAGGQRILVDCGMKQGGRMFEQQALPDEARGADCVVLTHAHIDHSGMLPALYASGFRGPVHCTPATASLCDIMLRDSAHIQESEAAWRNRKAERSGAEPYVPLYGMDDVEGILALFAPLGYENAREIAPGVILRLSDAGHLLGSASASLTVRHKEGTRTVVFSGDIGNTDQPIIKDPVLLKNADYAVMESTYGDRSHGPKPDYIADLADTLQSTFDRGGNVVIPAFAVGRSQEILFFLREIKEKGLIRGHEGFPVYMDSPMAIRTTQVFLECDRSCFDEETLALLRAGINPVSFPDLVPCLSVDESKAINLEKRPCVIISASGMCEAGRIRHHLKHNLWRPECTILFVGYQGVGTLGRALAEGAQSVRLFGEEITVSAKIRALKAISGHADREGLLRWAASFEPAPAHVFVTHGDAEVAESFASLLKSRGMNASAPVSGEAWSLDTGLQTARGREAKPAPADLPGRKPASAAVVQALERLARLAQRSGDFSNALQARLARQLETLASEWDEREAG